MKPTSSKNNIEFIKTLSKRLVIDDSNRLPPIESEALGKAINELQVYQAELELQNEELRLVQGELESNRNKYYELFNNAPAGYFLIDHEFNIIEANVAALDLLGVKRVDLQNKPFMGYIRSSDHLRLNSLLKDILGNKKKKHIIVQVKRLDNSFRTIKLDGILTEALEYGGTQIMLTASDLTELQQTQNALSESENLYRSLVQSSLDHIFMLSTDGFFLASNDQVSQYDLESGEDLVGRNLDQIYSPEISARYVRKLHDVVSSRKAVFFEHVIEKEEETLYRMDRLYPIMKEHRIWAIGGISHDISVQRFIEEEKGRLERQLRQAQKLEALGNLAGGIAHDFNNILSAILGFSELALSEVEENSAVADDLREIYRGGTRAKELVKQILLFARQSRETIVPTHVASVAEEVVKFIRSTIPSTIEITTDIQSDSTVMGNETQIHQIFMNLCTNAYQAMEPEGGTLHISIKDLERVDILEPNLPESAIETYIEVKVTDTGHGIDENMLDYIFDPYFTTKQMGDGSGMGLAVVYSIIESYHGRICVESEKGKGTAFTILLPVTSEEQEKSDIESGNVPHGSENILFIDDEVVITKMGKQLLEKIGYSVTTKTSSVEALEIFRQSPEDFDLVVTDMTMPYLKGDKLAEEMLKIRPNIPIILCTGYSKYASEKSLEELNIKALVSKPLILSHFARKVRNVLDEAQP